MEEISRVRFFLGANTSEGFFSLYDELKKEASFIWYIKGGPGNGKSTFMRSVASAAEAAGHEVEYALCSGDPDSLDGIIIPDLGMAYVDATSPHIQEPGLPGAGGRYIDLSMFYKSGAVFDASAIEDCFSGYRAEYARAYDLFRAAVLASPVGIPGILTKEDTERAYGSGKEFAEHRIPEGSGLAEHRRFMTAYTCNGFYSCFSKTVPGGKTYLVDDSFHLADAWLLGAAEVCRKKQQDMILCPDPLIPEKTQALLVPDAGLSFIRMDKGMKIPGKPAGTICPGVGAPSSLLPDLQTEIRTAASLRRRLLDLGMSRLKKAKEIHDELESLYLPHVDFNALTEFTADHIRRLHIQ